MEENEEEIEYSFIDSETASSDEESSLQIVLESPKTPKRQKKIQEIEGNNFLDKKIDELTDKCENFTPEVAKKILMKLVKNEHILALSLLKAEEEAEKERRKASESEEDGARSEPELPSTPKLTRLKAKQTNTTLPLPGPFKNTQPDEEVVALIREDMKSDDEDDEYQPCEDEAMSDDEYNTNTTMSDIDSMPSTPGSALFNNDMSPEKCNEFKVPRPKLTLEEQENVARRTRSKLSLTTTPIETIESTFIPPDITLDMYDFPEQEERDSEWVDFLNEFMMPLTNIEEDDAEDPEYVAAENAPIDKEELRHVPVSKKEYNQLLSELMEDSVNFMDLNDDVAPYWSRKAQESASKKNRLRISSPIQTVRSPRLAAHKPIPNDPMLNTPPIKTVEEVQTTPVREPPIEQVDKSLVLTPNQYSTPEKFYKSSPVFHTPIVTTPMTPQPQFTSTPQITGVYRSADLSQINSTSQILVVNSQNQLELVSSSNILNQAFDNNGIVQLPQYQSVVIQVPTVDLLQNRIPQILAAKETYQETPSKIIDELPIDESPDVDVTLNETKEITKRKSKKSKFEEFVDLESRTHVEHVFPSNSVGFTPQQWNIFEQQMRMHSQLLTQNYMQLYSHPKLWPKAEDQKKKLLELETLLKPEVSPFNAGHIKTCIEVIKSWEMELEENNERNKSYAKFLYDEMEVDLEKKSALGRFHPRLMEHLLNSTAIVYPSLLPHKPFRSVDFKLCDAPSSELTLWAFEIAKFYPTLKEKWNQRSKRNKLQQREPSVIEIAAELIYTLGPIRTEKTLKGLLEIYRSHKPMNPIKYVFKHKRYLNYEHKIEEVNLEKNLPPVKLRRGLLPKIWDAYMFSHQRLEKHPYQPEYEDKQDDVVIIEESEEIENIETTDVNNSLAATTKIENSFKIEFVYDKDPKINISFVPTQLEESSEIVSCMRLISPTKSVENSAEKKLQSILKKSGTSDKSPTKRKSVNFLLPPPEFVIPFTLEQKFFIVIESFFSKFDQSIKFKRSKDNLLPKIFVAIRNFDIYIQLIKISVMSRKKVGGESGEVSVKSKKNVTSEEFTNKLKKRLIATRNSIMETEVNKCTVEKDCSFAYNYLERVKISLLDNGDDDLFAEFMATLRSFDPTQQSVPELYYKIETLFQPNYADLVDLFITFLLPEHATEIGKFFENFILNNMQNLIKKLNLVFNKQPSHIKKVLACLNELSNERNVTIEVVKERLFPLLKGNQLLIDWFTQLFDKPPECPLSEYEVLNIKKSASDDSSEEGCEEISRTDLTECENIDEMRSCGVRYKNGKIYYYCGTLLPAKISFLANDAKLPPTKEIADVKKTLCVHEIRKHVKFNESKKVEETNENSKKTLAKKNKKKEDDKKVKKKPKLCDDNTLHAHAVRLNPVHAQDGEKLSDLMHYLQPDSPRKRRKTGNSPKKNKSSPTTETISSPPSPTKTAKPDDTSTDEPVKKKMKSEEIVVPRVTTTIVSASSFSSKKPRNEAASTSKKETEDKKKVGDRSSENWTRDEDKIILEEIKTGYDDTNKLITVLLSKLKRTRAEIHQRYLFLLDLVMMMN